MSETYGSALTKFLQTALLQASASRDFIHKSSKWDCETWPLRGGRCHSWLEAGRAQALFGGGSRGECCAIATVLDWKTELFMLINNYEML
jgi:hypothetical protein